MKFELGRVNLYLCFIDVEHRIAKRSDCEDVINTKNMSYEASIAFGMLNQIVEYVNDCLKQNKEPMKTVFYLTHKPTCDQIDKIVHSLDLWKYIDIKRAPVDGFTFNEIKHLTNKYKNIVMVNLNCINEFVNDTHYTHDLKDEIKLYRDLKKDLYKLAKKTNSCLTFGRLLYQENWLQRHIEETKETYSCSRRFPYEFISIVFSETFGDGFQFLRLFDYEFGKLVYSKEYEIDLNKFKSLKKVEEKQEEVHEKPKKGLFKFVTGWKKPN